MLRVPGLVEERAPVVHTADRLDDEHDAVRHLDRRAEGAWRLLLTRLDVELDVLLRPDVDAELRQRRLERRQHRVGGELLVPLGCAEEPRDVPALCLVERDAEALSEQRLDRLLEQALRVGEDGAALVRQLVELEAEAAVQLDGVGRAEILHRLQRDCRRLAVDRVHVLLGQLVPRLLERSPLVAVGLVRRRRTQHAEADLLAVHVRLDRRLERGDLLRVLLRQVRRGIRSSRSARARGCFDRRSSRRRAQSHFPATSARDSGRRSPRCRASPCDRRSACTTRPAAPRGSGRPSGGWSLSSALVSGSVGIRRRITT